MGPVLPDSQTLVVHANGILEAVQMVYEQENVDLPARQFITVGGPGDTAWDCEQLSVSIEQIYNGLPGQQGQAPTTCNEPKTALAIVQLVRCIPIPATAGRGNMVPVAPSDIIESGERFMVDAWLMMIAGQLFGDSQSFLGSMSDVTIGPPQGGYQAVSMTLIAAVV